MRKKSEKKTIYVKMKLTLEEKENTDALAHELEIPVCDYLRKIYLSKSGFDSTEANHLITIIKNRTELLADIRATALYRINILTQILPILQELKKNPALTTKFEAYEMFCLFLAHAEHLHNKKKKVSINVH